MEIIKFPKKCGTCGDFEKCFKESTEIINKHGTDDQSMYAADKEMTRECPACEKYYLNGIE